MPKASSPKTDDVSKRVPALFAGQPMTGHWTSTKTKALKTVSRFNWKPALSQVNLVNPKIDLKHKKNIIAGLILVNLSLVGATAHQEYPGRVQQAQAMDAMITVRPATNAVTVQPVKAPEAMIAEVTAEVVEPTPVPTTQVAGVSISRQPFSCMTTRGKVYPGNAGAMVRAAATAKWGAYQADKLMALMGRESGLNPYACNTSSGACGIPQALPCSKLINVIGSLDNVEGQVQWLLSYVQNRYGTPEAALGHHNARGWY